MYSRQNLEIRVQVDLVPAFALRAMAGKAMRVIEAYSVSERSEANHRSGASRRSGERATV